MAAQNVKEDARPDPQAILRQTLQTLQQSSRRRRKISLPNLLRLHQRLSQGVPEPTVDRQRETLRGAYSGLRG